MYQMTNHHRKEKYSFDRVWDSMGFIWDGSNAVGLGFFLNKTKRING